MVSWQTMEKANKGSTFHPYNLLFITCLKMKKRSKDSQEMFANARKKGEYLLEQLSMVKKYLNF